MATYSVYVFNLSSVNDYNSYDTTDVTNAIMSAVKSGNPALIGMVYDSLDVNGVSIINEECVKTSKELSSSHIQDCRTLLEAMDDANIIGYESTYGDTVLVVAISDDEKVESWKIVSQGTCRLTTFDFVDAEDASNQYRATIESE